MTREWSSDVHVARSHAWGTGQALALGGTNLGAVGHVSFWVPFVHTEEGGREEARKEGEFLSIFGPYSFRSISLVVILPNISCTCRSSHTEKNKSLT